MDSRFRGNDVTFTTPLLPKGTLFVYNCECYDICLVSCPWRVLNGSHDNL